MNEEYGGMEVREGGSAGRPAGTPGGARPGGAPGGPRPGGGAPGGPRPGGTPPNEAPPAPEDGDARAEIEEFVTRWYQAQNSRDWQALHGMMTANHTDHTWFGSEPVSPQAVTRIFDEVMTAYGLYEERLRAIISVSPATDGPGYWVVTQSNGRGTQEREFAGRPATGVQIGSPHFHCFRVVREGNDWKMAEYIGSPNPWVAPVDDPITAPSNLLEARAEQGGSIVPSEVVAARERLARAYAQGQIGADEFSMAMAEIPEPRRCQALEKATLKRCLNAAMPNQLYCEIHARDVDPVHTMNVP